MQCRTVKSNSGHSTGTEMAPGYQSWMIIIYHGVGDWHTWITHQIRDPLNVKLNICLLSKVVKCLKYLVSSSTDRSSSCSIIFLSFTPCDVFHRGLLTSAAYAPINHAVLTLNSTLLRHLHMTLVVHHNHRGRTNAGSCDTYGAIIPVIAIYIFA